MYKLILIISILLNVILIYNLGDYKLKIKDLKKINRVNQNVIYKWIDEEIKFNHREDYDSFNRGYNE